MQKHIELMEGDSLIVYAVSREPPPPITPEPVEDLRVLLQISGVNIYTNEDGSYVCFKSNLDVCNDGTGPAHGDPHHQAQTAYYNGGKYLNADTDRYMVIPPQIRQMVPSVVMGCQAKLTNLETDASSAAVTGDIGPSSKTGEAAYCLAKIVNPNVGHNIGDDKQIYFYELWPGVPAVVDGKTYHLQPA
jgi:hypothetical protein